MAPESVHTPKLNLKISPRLINSANPWATTKEDLQVLYDCPYTGAVTIRTSLLEPFSHDHSIHQYTFYSSSSGTSAAKVNSEGRSEVVSGETSSLNTLGYSPISLPRYIEILSSLHISSEKTKPFIVSVTGSPKDIFECLVLLNEAQGSNDSNLLMEINLSCPNIPNKPPPAYDFVSLKEYMYQVSLVPQVESKTAKSIHVGIKTPPYTYSAQFEVLIKALEESIAFAGGCPISFITATNTLGSSLVLNDDNLPALGSANGSGIGGLAGDALHPLALGNVKTIRAMLDASSFSEVQRIAIIGVGGVKDAAGYKRMRSVGADVVGVGTALGRDGVAIFSSITEGLSEGHLA